MKRLTLTAVCTLALLAAAPAAHASFTISPAGAITMPSTGRLTFSTSLGTFACNVTMVGSLFRGPISEGGEFGENLEHEI